MPYTDNNASRRNLIVWSLAIIVFNLGGGTLPDGELKLPLVSVQLSTPQNIVLVPWLILGWFAYRFHLSNLGEFSRSLNEAIWNSWEIPSFQKTLVAKLEKSKPDAKLIFSRGDLPKGRHNLFRASAVVAYWSDGIFVTIGRNIIEFGSHQYSGNIDDEGIHSLKLDPIEAKILILRCIQLPITSYLMPHLLWTLAIASYFFSCYTQPAV